MSTLQEVKEFQKRDRAKHRAGQVEQYETEGYALAMEVLQSDLYHHLTDKARAECDVFILRGQA